MVCRRTITIGTAFPQVIAASQVGRPITRAQRSTSLASAVTPTKVAKSSRRASAIDASTSLVAAARTPCTESTSDSQRQLSGSGKWWRIGSYSRT
jgi:hypothetical protein